MARFTPIKGITFDTDQQGKLWIVPRKGATFTYGTKKYIAEEKVDTICNGCALHMKDLCRSLNCGSYHIIIKEIKK